MAAATNLIPSSQPNEGSTEEQLHHLQLDNSTSYKRKDSDTHKIPLSTNEQAELESAATVIQSIYRGNQARRELYGPALTASQKWRHLIDYSRIEYIHKMDAKDKDHHQAASPATPEDPNQALPASPQTPNESKTRWAWRRAEFLGSRLGKVIRHVFPFLFLLLHDSFSLHPPILLLFSLFFHFI
ncbi:hypothetical protein BC939DRAFT_69612 [Gamsiella multidivaricata]|uniref:uncharacterized protein n=1 Tax=Gamsiella multidivaricata TaxID=101098 RepID=UPI00221E5714|nr:uncharacterized protein BC939DRAFT_69612 [Gamsiella multidivaricata]KAI7828166.1 hypothetical protein BC939DRAFT_69612 [Gamsiella multidivaricata]